MIKQKTLDGAIIVAGEVVTLKHCPFNYGEHTVEHGENRDEVGNRYAWADYCLMCRLVLRSSSKKQVGKLLQ